MMAEEVKIDNYDVDNLRLLEELICSQDILPNEDNHIAQEEGLQQDAKEQAIVSRILIMNHAPMTGKSSRCRHVY